MKLEINKSYSLYTTSNYISNKKVKVLGFVGYDRASQYKTFVENVAINEKYIDISGDTDTYLRKMIFYDCGVIDYNNGEWDLTGEHVIVWDDIIDMDRTTRLYDEYVYRLGITFKNLSSTDVITKEDVIKLIKNAINSTYNSEKTKVGLEIEAVSDNALDAVETQLEKTRAMLDEANECLGVMVTLQEASKEIITDIKDNDLVNKVNAVNDVVDNILSNTEIILQNTK